MTCNEITLRPYVDDFNKDNGWIIVGFLWYMLPFYLSSQKFSLKIELSIAPIFIEAIMLAVSYLNNRWRKQLTAGKANNWLMFPVRLKF